MVDLPPENARNVTYSPSRYMRDRHPHLFSDSPEVTVAGAERAAERLSLPEQWARGRLAVIEGKATRRNQHRQ